MTDASSIVIILAGFVFVSGCRTATRITDVPRVDLKLEGGNRGYLVGVPPEGAQLAATRQMVATDIELPSFYRPKRRGTAVSLEQIAPPETEGLADAAGGVTVASPRHHDTYMVQQGDSLWSIAAKPEIYGKATRWRVLFDANRDLLKTPDSLKAGMTLSIPRGPGSESGEDEGTAFRK